MSCVNYWCLVEGESVMPHIFWNLTTASWLSRTVWKSLKFFSKAHFALISFINSKLTKMFFSTRHQSLPTDEFLVLSQCARHQQTSSVGVIYKIKITSNNAQQSTDTRRSRGGKYSEQSTAIALSHIATLQPMEYGVFANIDSWLTCVFLPAVKKEWFGLSPLRREAWQSNKKNVR